MDDEIIDTNVLLVASARDANSPFKDSDVPAEDQQRVLDWLMTFRRDGQRRLVLDQSFKIWDEYHNKLIRGQDIGSLVVMEKLQLSLVRFVDIEYDANGHGCLPPDLESVVHDLADRKMAAVALADLAQGEKSAIVNAVDSDWRRWEKDLKRFGITVKHLLENKDRERKPKKPKR